MLLMRRLLPLHANALFLFAVNAHSEHGARICCSSLCKNDVMLFSARRVDNGFSLPRWSLSFSRSHFPPLLLLPVPLSCIYVSVHTVLRMFINYQVKFIHISCLITDPADNSFENIIYEDMKMWDEAEGEDGACLSQEEEEVKFL